MNQIVGTAPSFRKRPVVIQAMRLPEAYPEGVDPSSDGYARNLAAARVVDWLRSHLGDGFNPDAEEAPVTGWSIDPSTGFLLIATLKLMMQAKPGDWIIRGVGGEFYPCKPDIFEATYEAVEVEWRAQAAVPEHSPSPEVKPSVETVVDLLDEYVDDLAPLYRAAFTPAAKHLLDKLWPGRTEQEVKAEALEAYAADVDREAAESAATHRVAGVRCCSCDLRYEERQEYSCTIPGTAHRYDETELLEASEIVIEPTYTGDEIRARAAALRGGQ